MAYTNQGTRDRSELPKAYRNTTTQGTRPAKVPYQKLSQLAFSLPWLSFSISRPKIVHCQEQIHHQPALNQVQAPHE